MPEVALTCIKIFWKTICYSFKSYKRVSIFNLNPG
nr:MAG TPA_asm: hypothetical protein [Bacteriophage sp.]